MLFEFSSSCTNIKLMEKEKKPAEFLKISLIIVLSFIALTGCCFVIWQVSSQKSSKKVASNTVLQTQKEIDDLNKKIDELNGALKDAQTGSSSEESSVKGATTQKDEQSTSAKINLNTATLQQLDTLEGIGQVYAQRIIDYRETNGGFKTIEEVKNIKGIGDKTFQKIADRLSV